MSNPLAEIEDRKAWQDFGRQAHMVYQGARQDGASHARATQLVAAFFAGMFEGVQRLNQPQEDEDA